MTNPPAATAANGHAATAQPSHDDLLRLNGFLAMREQIAAIAQQAGQIQPEIYAAAIHFAEQAKSRAQLEGADPAQLDQMDAQIRTLNAVSKLRQELKRIEESTAARERLRG